LPLKVIAFPRHSLLSSFFSLSLSLSFPHTTVCHEVSSFAHLYQSATMLCCATSPQRWKQVTTTEALKWWTKIKFSSFNFLSQVHWSHSWGLYSHNLKPHPLISLGVKISIYNMNFEATQTFTLLKLSFSLLVFLSYVVILTILIISAAAFSFQTIQPS
jgi:hypothetical protein